MYFFSRYFCYFFFFPFEKVVNIIRLVSRAVRLPSSERKGRERERDREESW